MRKMRKIIKAIFIIVFLLVTPMLINRAIADAPPDPGGGPGTGDPPVGGGAPLGGGMIILLALGSGYGAKKIYNNWKK